MTTESAGKTEHQASEVHPGVSPHRSAADLVERDHLGPVHLQVFDLMSSEQRPLTLGQIARLAKVPRAELLGVVSALCEVHLVRHLNTIIESYIAHPTSFR